MYEKNSQPIFSDTLLEQSDDYAKGMIETFKKVGGVFLTF